METSNYIFFLFFPIISVWEFINMLINRIIKKLIRIQISSYEPNLNPSWPLNELEKLI